MRRACRRRPGRLSCRPCRSLSPARYVPYAFARAHRAGRRRVGRRARGLDRRARRPVQALAELLAHAALSAGHGAQAGGRAGGGDLARLRAQEGTAAAVVDEVESDLDLSRLLQDMPEIEDLLETEDDAPIIRMINALLTQALREGASDIHIEPFETHSVVRFRIDGTLRDVVAAAARAARRADLAHQDHGAARHRREAPAAGRPHHAARRRPADRRAGLHAAHRARRARGAAPARQGGRPARPGASSA